VGAGPLFEAARRVGRIDELDGLIKAAIEPLDAHERAARLASYAGLFEGWESGAEKAFETYLKSLQLDFDAHETRTHVWRLAAELDAWPLLVRFFDLLTDLAHDPQDRFAFLRQRAELEFGRLNERDTAFNTMKRAISLVPNDDRARAILEGWASEQGQLAEVAQFYEDEGGWAEQEGARIALFRAAADLYRQLDAADDAARMVHQISELDPDDDQLVDERIELLERARDVVGLSKVLQLQIDRARGERRESLLRKLAILHDSPVGDSAIAENAWHQLLDSQPGDQDAFNALVRLHRLQENWTALESIMSLRSTVLEGPELHSLLRQRAEICASALDRQSQAFDLLASVAEESIEDGSILIDMEKLIEQRPQAVELVRLAEQTLSALVEDDHPPVLKLISRVAQTHLGRPQTAMNALTRALQYTPDDLHLARELLRLQREQRKHAECLVTYQTYGPALIETHDGQDVPALKWYLDVARLQESNLLDFQGAAETYEALLVEFPGDRRALMGLRNLLGRLRQLPRLVEVVSELAAMTDAPKDVMLLVEGARSITSMGELSIAIPLWAMVLDRAPGHDEAQDTVMRHGRRVNDLTMMRSVYRAKIRSSKSERDTASAWCSLATFEREVGSDDDAAMTAYQNALNAQAHYEPALMGLAELSLLHNRQDRIPALATVMIQRFDAGLDDVLKDDFADVLGQLQIERANMAMANTDDIPAEETEAEVLEILSVGYARAPHLRDLAQMYADQLYSAGRLVEAGRIYDETMFPSFIRGALGDELRAKEHLRRAHALQSIQLDVQAIHHFESAARHSNTRVEALAALAQIQEKAERWEAAARFREKLADVVEDPARAAASLFAAGQLLEVQLGRFHRALTLYRRAIQAGLREPMMLLTILDVLEKGGHRSDAAEVIDRLLEIDLSNRSKAKLLTRRARLMGSEEGWTAALKGLLDAISMEPEDAERIDELLGLLENQEPIPESLRGQLDSVLSQFQSHWTADHMMRLSKWYASEGEISHAIQLVEHIEIDSDNGFAVLDGRSRLYAARFQETGSENDFRSALHNRLASLQSLPGDPVALRHLHEVLRVGEREVAALLPLGLLNVLGQASSTEIEFIKALSAESTALTFDAQLVRGHPPQIATAVEALLAGLLNTVGEALDHAFRLARSEENEGWISCDDGILQDVEDIRDLTHWPALEIGTIPGSSRGPEVLSFEPARVLLPTELVDGMTRYRRRFFLGRSLYLAQGTGVFLSCLPPEESLAIMAGAIALLSPATGPEYALSMGADEDGIAYWAEFILENTTEDIRQSLSPLADVVAGSGPDAFLEWADWVYGAANRAALMLSGDLAGAIRALKSESEGGRAQVVSGPVAFRNLLADVPEIARLHSFAFQDAFWRTLGRTPTDTIVG